jgi:hypothetical protein
MTRWIRALIVVPIALLVSSCGGPRDPLHGASGNIAPVSGDVGSSADDVAIAGFTNTSKMTVTLDSATTSSTRGVEVDGVYVIPRPPKDKAPPEGVTRAPFPAPLTGIDAHPRFAPGAEATIDVRVHLTSQAATGNLSSVTLQYTDSQSTFSHTYRLYFTICSGASSEAPCQLAQERAQAAT